MPAEVQTLETRDARADFVRAALRVLGAFEAPELIEAIARLDEVSDGDFYQRLRDLEAANSRWRMYSLPADMVRP